MLSKTDITGLDKAVILAELVNSFDISKLHADLNSKYKMTTSEAQSVLSERRFFSYLRGRPLHIYFTEKDGREFLIRQKEDNLPDEWINRAIEKAVFLSGFSGVPVNREGRPVLFLEDVSGKGKAPHKADNTEVSFLAPEEKAVLSHSRQTNGSSVTVEELCLRSRIAVKEFC